MNFIKKFAFIFICTLLVFAIGCKSGTRSKEDAPSGPAKSSVVDFPGMQLRPGGDKTSYTLAGRIRNRSSQQTISEVRLRLTMEDVLATGAATTVGNTFVTVRQELPPGQSKSFSEKVVFKEFSSPKGRHEWNYSIAEIKVKE